MKKTLAIIPGPTEEATNLDLEEEVIEEDLLLVSEEGLEVAIVIINLDIKVDIKVDSEDVDSEGIDLSLIILSRLKQTLKTQLIKFK